MLGENKITKRINWLDAAKGFTIIFVVFGHVLVGYSENNTFPAAETLIINMKNFIYIWHMPFFMFMSGFAFALSVLDTERGEETYIIKKDKLYKSIFNWIIVYLIFEIGLSVSNLIFAGYVDNPTKASEIIETIFFPTNILWYLWAIIILYVIFSKVFAVKHSKYIVLFALVVISILTFVLDDSYNIRRCFEGIFGYAIYFYTGIIFEKEQSHIKKIYNGKKTALKFIFCLCYAIGFTFLMCEKSYKILNSIIRNGLELIAAFSIIFLLLNCFQRVRLLGESKILISLGKGSLVIYVLHTYFVTAIRYLVVHSGCSNVVFAIIISFAVPILVSYLIYIISIKVKWVGYFFRPINLIEKVKRR